MKIGDAFPTLMALGLLSAAIPWCAAFGYWGLWKGETLTNLGMRRGLLARIWGVIYLVYLVVSLVLLPYLIYGMFSWNLSDVMAELATRVFASSEVAFTFIGLGAITFAVFVWTIQYRIKRDPSFANNPAQQRATRLFLLPIGIVLVGLGFFFLIGTPKGVILLLYWTFILFVMSPQRAKFIFTKGS